MNKGAAKEAPGYPVVNGHSISKGYEVMFPNNCPVREFTADKEFVGVCTFYLPDGKTCPRHGIVKESK